MTYGEDRADGFVRGRHFLHPKLGFSFMAPEGFMLDNTPQAALGAREGGDQALRLDVVKVPAEQSLIEFLNSGWIENIENGSLEELSVNGVPAATAIGSGRSGSTSSGSAARSTASSSPPRTARRRLTARFESRFRPSAVCRNEKRR
jgi:predicted Zn-dependent protease